MSRCRATRLAIALLASAAAPVPAQEAFTPEIAPGPYAATMDSLKPVAVGKIEIPKAGVLEVRVRPKDTQAWTPINLRALKLTPAP